TTTILVISMSGLTLPRLTQSHQQQNARQRRADETSRLLHEAATTADDLARHRLLNQVVVVNTGVAKAIAARYRNRGIAQEDLEQVAMMGLVKASHGYDESTGHNFLSYAVPTITGEVRRHFRDHGWMVRPPRRVQELQAGISTADAELSHQLGRSPRPSEVAAFLGVDVEEVNEALAAEGCFTPTSLDQPVGADRETTLGGLLGEFDPGRSAVEARAVLAPIVRGLSARDRHIVYLRFFSDWTQQQIAEDIGVTQMQVSRLLTRILSNLRSRLETPSADALAEV
ncbi:MAG: SigB/SigF/SigG family RNA polymerase sigma factor, partial [Nocardioidaceae bacterium]